MAVLYLALWSVELLLTYASHSYAGTFRDPFHSAWLDLLMWTFVGGACFALGWLLPFDRGITLKHGFGVVLSAIGVAVMRIVLINALDPLLGAPVQDVVGEFVQTLPGSLLVNASYVGLGSGVASVTRYEREQAHLAEVHRQLTDSRLAALRTHLRPDFVDRIFEGIASHLRTEPDVAAARLGRLAEFLQLQLGRAQLQTVTIEEELDLVAAYNDLDQLYSDVPTRFAADVQKDALRARVPPNCVLILVECAIRYRAGASGPNTVSAVIRTVNGQLHIEVHDEFPAPARLRTGGNREYLAELATVLEHQYGSSAVPEFSDRDNGPGVVSQLRIPLENTSYDMPTPTHA